MKQPTEQQLKDPKWWDENDPSKGEATHFDVADGSESSWMRLEDGNWTYWFGAWGKTSQPLGRMIPRPQPTPWQGPQDGLPPVGTECEVDTRFGWLPGKIIDHGDDYALVHLYENEHNLKVDWSRTGFRLIQSEMNLLLEKAMKHVSFNYSDSDINLCDMFAQNLYDAGMLVDPEHKPMSRAKVIENLMGMKSSIDPVVPFMDVDHANKIADALGYKE